MGCFIYAIFGSCRDITIGPTALMALMTYQQVINRNPDFAVLLCFLSGVVQIIMCLCRLGMPSTILGANSKSKMCFNCRGFGGFYINSCDGWIYISNICNYSDIAIKRASRFEVQIQWIFRYCCKSPSTYT